ncbi:MAG: hypothetical protein LBC20_05470 [Planctomycetaceae bacterium]|jgi:hypothetical protein|nr:hypothetical protein [Planctomycetaceae bacterium]
MMNDISVQIRRYLEPVKVRAVRFRCVNEKPVEVILPTLRGVWGRALHQIDQTLYNTVFEGKNRTNQKQPLYIIRPDLNCSYENCKTFSFEWIVWNSAAQQYFDNLLQSWEVAGLLGLGKDRVRFKIIEAEYIFATKNRTDSINSSTTSISAELPIFSPAELQWTFENHVRQLAFPHSIRLLQKGKLITEPTLWDIVVSIFYRLSPIIVHSLGNIPSNRPGDDWMPCSQVILDLIRTIPNQWHGKTVTLRRYSARQQQEIDMNGVFGSLFVETLPDEIKPLILAADLFHLGKGTIMGLGRLLPITS